MTPDRQAGRADRRPWPVAIAVALGLAGTLVAFLGVRDAGRERLVSQFDHTAANLERGGRQILSAELDVLADVRDVFDAAGTLSRRAFGVFVRAQLARHPGIRALEWVPVVPLAERPRYEAAARADGLAGFRFTERDAQGRLVAAARRPTYYPVFYVEPLAGNEAALGYTPVLPERDEAMARARETGLPAATEAFSIVQASKGPLGVAVFVPVFRPPGRLQGFVEGVFQPEIALESLRKEAAALGVDVSLVDELASPGRQVLMGSPEHPNALRHATTIALGARRWTLSFTLADERKLEPPRGLEWVVLLVGLAGTTALGVAIHGLMARRAAAEALASERAAALEQARVLDRMKTNFVNGVAHDLRSPLTTILGYAEFLEEGLPPEQQRYVAQITRGARRLERMMDDLLDLARVDAGIFQLKRTRTDVGPLLAEVAEGVKPLVAEAGVNLELAAAAGPLPAELDAARIERLVFNLVHNAVKFTPDGGTIRLAATPVDGRVRVEVSDTGPGIPADQRSRLFKRFSQLEGGMDKGGSGLGLSISKAIVDAHGGAIGVESEPGRGATFWFELPAAGPG